MFVFFCIFVFMAIYFCNVYLKNRVQSRLAVANTSWMMARNPVEFLTNPARFLAKSSVQSHDHFCIVSHIHSNAQRVVAAISVFVNSIKISANTETAMLSIRGDGDDKSDGDGDADQITNMIIQR